MPSQLFHFQKGFVGIYIVSLSYYNLIDFLLQLEINCMANIYIPATGSCYIVTAIETSNSVAKWHNLQFYC